MKKVVFSIIVLLGYAMFSGCIKNTPYITTINPALTATIGNYKFVSSSVTPATIDTQVVDTSTTLVVTGLGSDKVHPYDKIIVAVANYKGVPGTYSIVQGQAGARYYHNGFLGIATGGIVSISKVTTTTISGYFSFNTNLGDAVTAGEFVVGLP